MARNIVALAGGVGGARLAHGLYQVLQPGELTVIVNTGDDFSIYGLHISPDVDTVCYTLAGMEHPDTGWGISGDNFNALKQAARLGGEDWFRLGDLDLGTHLVRTQRMAAGEKLSSITRDFCTNWGIKAQVMPMSDEPVRTKVITKDGQTLAFQEYFVLNACQPEVSRFEFDGIADARPANGVLQMISNSDMIIICPSNPWVSIDPILAVPSIREQMQGKCTLAVSPLIGGKAVKGPLGKMYHELGIEPSSRAVAEHYRGLIEGMVIDHKDKHEKKQIEAFGIMTKTSDILMKDAADRKSLAEEILEFGTSLSTDL